MNIEVKYRLPFIEVTICYRGEVLHLKQVLLDTGSAGTIFSADVVDAIGVKVEPGDVLNKTRGGGELWICQATRLGTICQPVSFVGKKNLRVRPHVNTNGSFEPSISAY